MLVEVEAVLEALEGMGTGYLNEYYKRATKSKTNGFRVTPLDMLAEWNKWAEQRQWDLQLPPDMRGDFGTESTGRFGPNRNK